MNRLPLLLLAALAIPPTTAPAVTLYGLTATNGLIRFDSASPGSVTAIGTISQPGIQDIDFYPVNGVLYGATSEGNLYRIDTATAQASLAATANGAVAITGLTDIDFNPAADRLRIFAANDRNFRLVPDINNSNPGTPGAITDDGVFSNSAVNLVGAAYSNNFDGVAAASTSLFSIDSVSNSLFLHSVGPAFSTVTLVGPEGALGFDAGVNVGFDIDQSGVAWLSNDSSLYTLNLQTGAATLTGTVGSAGLTSIAAAVPEASTASILLLTGLAALRRRSRS